MSAALKSFALLFSAFCFCFGFIGYVIQLERSQASAYEAEHTSTTTSSAAAPRRPLGASLVTPIAGLFVSANINLHNLRSVKLDQDSRGLLNSFDPNQERLANAVLENIATKILDGSSATSQTLHNLIGDRKVEQELMSAVLKDLSAGRPIQEAVKRQGSQYLDTPHSKEQLVISLTADLTACSAARELALTLRPEQRQLVEKKAPGLLSRLLV